MRRKCIGGTCYEKNDAFPADRAGPGVRLCRVQCIGIYDPYAGDYSNVSTTRNGTVNGTNGRYAGYGYYDGNTAYNGTYNGTYSAYPNAGTTRSTTTTTNGRTGTAAGTGSYTGTTSGTGMTGGR